MAENHLVGKSDCHPTSALGTLLQKAQPGAVFVPAGLGSLPGQGPTTPGNTLLLPPLLSLLDFLFGFVRVLFRREKGGGTEVAADTDGSLP